MTGRCLCVVAAWRPGGRATKCRSCLMLMRPKPSFYPPPLGPTRERGGARRGGDVASSSSSFSSFRVDVAASVGFRRSLFCRVWSQIGVNMKFPIPLPIRSLFVVIMNRNQNDNGYSKRKSLSSSAHLLPPLEQTHYRLSHNISDASGRLNVTEVELDSVEKIYYFDKANIKQY